MGSAPSRDTRLRLSEPSFSSARSGRLGTLVRKFIMFVIAVSSGEMGLPLEISHVADIGEVRYLCPTLALAPAAGIIAIDPKRAIGWFVWPSCAMNPPMKTLRLQWQQEQPELLDQLTLWWTDKRGQARAFTFTAPPVALPIYIKVRPRVGVSLRAMSLSSVETSPARAVRAG